MSEVIAKNTPQLDFIEQHQAPQMARDILSLAGTAMRFACIERVPRYSCTRRENNAEHSLMLSLVSIELAARYFPDIDLGLVAQFPPIHDLPELETDDIPTYTLSDTELASKEAAEQSAAPRVARSLPPYIGSLLLEYEKQERIEARLVRFVDKTLPVSVDILGPGVQVMREDYGITTEEQLHGNAARLSSNFRHKFADAAFEQLHQARDILAFQFAAKFALETANL